MFFLPIGGTWSWGGWKTRGQWWQPDSPLVAALARDGVQHIAPQQPFIWTTSLNGHLFGHERDWDAGGAALRTYFRPIRDSDETPYIRLADRNIVAHSHAIGVVAYALACYDLRLNSVITLGSPVRKSIEALLRDGGLRNVNAWLHVWCEGDDMQRRGGFFDRRFGVRRQIELPGVENVEIPGYFGHSGILDIRHYGAWRVYGLVDFLRASKQLEISSKVVSSS